MLAVHIETSPEEIIVSRLDCVLARYEWYVDSIPEFLVEVLQGLGHVVEVDDDLLA